MSDYGVAAKLGKFSNKMAREKSLDIYRTLKKAPSKYCFGPKGKLQSVTFRDIEGLDIVVISNKQYKKLHPYEAPVFITAGKYLTVPDYLFGPLKYASETINIEQLEIDDKTNSHYQDTGEKLHAMVTGSCASITISAITVKFVEDMCNKYNTYNKFDRKSFDLLNKEFRAEYDKRVANFLCGKGIKPKISWFKNKLERKETKGPWDRKTRKRMGCHKGKRGFAGTRKANKYGL
tara:strand:+ start:68 stop:769 length:702 start_codon:yes stop_codon:yes gene_type:complete